jgi:hypothetical protein
MGATTGRCPAQLIVALQREPFVFLLKFRLSQLSISGFAIKPTSNRDRTPDPLIEPCQ